MIKFLHDLGAKRYYILISSDHKKKEDQVYFPHDLWANSLDKTLAVTILLAKDFARDLYYGSILREDFNELEDVLSPEATRIIIRSLGMVYLPSPFNCFRDAMVTHLLLVLSELSNDQASL